jgi:hypothetical protein
MSLDPGDFVLKQVRSGTTEDLPVLFAITSQALGANLGVTAD